MTDAPRPRRDPEPICVFGPMLHLTVTVERGEDVPDRRPMGCTDEIHVHPGGQGFWIARMLRGLGTRPVLCGAAGGEIGKVLRTLIPAWGIETGLVDVDTRSPGYIHDRRNGRRRTVADQQALRFDRHEVDDLYGKTLETALATGTCVVTAAPTVPAGIFERLGSDLADAGVRAFGDLHGDHLAAFLAGGPLEMLKVSHEDLATDGWPVTDDRQIVSALDRLEEMGAADVVVSRAGHPALGRLRGRTYRAIPPSLEVVDHLGAGDSMTAGLVVAGLRGLAAPDRLRLACAAGAANVTRHGLGSGSADLVATLRRQVEVTEITTGAPVEDRAPEGGR